MLANLLFALLLVACGQAQIPERPGFPEFPLSAVQNMVVDTAGACNCVCARTAEVTLIYQTKPKYNACVGRIDRQRLCGAAWVRLGAPAAAWLNTFLCAHIIGCNLHFLSLHSRPTILQR